MTMQIPKSLITDSGIYVEEFPARVAAYSEALRAWLRHMHFLVAEMQHPPRKPDPSGYATGEKYREALARYELEVANLAQPYLPPDVRAVVIIALNTEWLPDFEIVEDAETQTSGSENT
jgi:hypothetical protein